MNTERFKMIASGYLFFVRDGSILLSRRFQTGYEDGKYSVPAGHIEEGETITDGTIREAREEVAISLTREDIQLVHVMHRKSDDIRVDFFYLVKQWSDEPVNNEQDRCDDVHWFPLNQLPQNIIPYIQSAITQYQNGNFYSEFGWA